MNKSKHQKDQPLSGEKLLEALWSNPGKLNIDLFEKAVNETFELKFNTDGKLILDQEDIVGLAYGLLGLYDQFYNKNDKESLTLIEQIDYLEQILIMIYDSANEEVPMDFIISSEFIYDHWQVNMFHCMNLRSLNDQMAYLLLCIKELENRQALRKDKFTQYDDVKIFQSEFKYRKELALLNPNENSADRFENYKPQQIKNYPNLKYLPFQYDYVIRLKEQEHINFNRGVEKLCEEFPDLNINPESFKRRLSSYYNGKRKRNKLLINRK